MYAHTSECMHSHTSECMHSQESPKAGQWTFDLSYWAFQQLAHPEYGIMMVDFRSVGSGTSRFRV